MTSFEHGLYGGAIAYAVSPSMFWWGVFFAIAPDIPYIVLGIYSGGLNKIVKRTLKGGKDDLPEYVYKVYDVTHSFITTFILLFVLYVFDKNLIVLSICYGSHIVLDIPFHDSRFSTRFLYPISNFHISGYSETKHKWVIFAQYPIIFVVYFLLFRSKLGL
ncbi:hypothetical protein HY024_01330 [Candidatus Curtissbacteria bacterium]|nr:hypothetical protein [Candidatus Curtissbacteria bacterium]